MEIDYYIVFNLFIYYIFIIVYSNVCTSCECHSPQDGIRRKLFVPFPLLLPFLAATPLPQPMHQIRAHLSWAHALSHAPQSSHAAALSNRRAQSHQLPSVRGILGYGEGRDTEERLLRPAWAKQRTWRGEKPPASEAAWRQGWMDKIIATTFSFHFLKK